MNIAKYLKRGNEKYDCKLFMEWEKEEISTAEALEKFKWNNKIEVNIEPGEFERFLGSLGYFRGKD